MGIGISKQWNGSKDTYLYIKSAPSEEEWKECWYREFIGNVLVGGDFEKQYSEEQAKMRSKELKERGDKKPLSDIEKELLNARNFAFDGFQTIHRSDVIFLSTSQYQDYVDKMRHGTRLDLGERENSWLTEEHLYKDR